VYFSVYEKHCDVKISSPMISRHDLEKMAGGLYKRPQAKVKAQSKTKAKVQAKVQVKAQK
jgi:hypothetical protein